MVWEVLSCSSNGEAWEKLARSMARQDMATGSSPDAMHDDGMHGAEHCFPESWLQMDESLCLWFSDPMDEFPASSSFFSKETQMWGLENNLFLCPFVTHFRL
jgi:hypothetical protein